MYSAKKNALYAKNNTEDKAHLAPKRLSDEMNRQTKWTWASHDFVLIKYCCEGNSHDAMFRCCGGALSSGNACFVQNDRSWCDGLGAFHIIAETIRN